MGLAHESLAEQGHTEFWFHGFKVQGSGFIVPGSRFMARSGFEAQGSNLNLNR